MPTPMIVLATEAGVDTELQLLPEIPELIWGFIAFSLLFIVISGRVFPQMNKALDERRAAIQGRIEEAEAQLAEAEKTRREYQESLSEARNEANQIIEDAKAQGERLKADLVARARRRALPGQRTVGERRAVADRVLRALDRGGGGGGVTKQALNTLVHALLWVASDGFARVDLKDVSARQICRTDERWRARRQSRTVSFRRVGKEDGRNDE